MCTRAHARRIALTTPVHGTLGKEKRDTRMCVCVYKYICVLAYVRSAWGKVKAKLARLYKQLLGLHYVPKRPNRYVEEALFN